MITYYFVFSFVASVLLVLLDLEVYKNPFNICTLLIIGLTAGFTTAFYAYKTFPRLTRLTGTITILLTIPVLFTGSAILLLALCNYPPAERLPEQLLPLQLPSAQENAAYIKRNLLFETKSECFIAPPNAVEKSTLFSTKCIKKREHVLTILSTITYAPPLRKREGEIYLPWNNANHRFYTLRDIYKTEIVRIKNLLKKNDTKAAQKIYLSLWQAITNIMKSKNDIVSMQTVNNIPFIFVMLVIFYSWAYTFQTKS